MTTYFGSSEVNEIAQELADIHDLVIEKDSELVKDEDMINDLTLEIKTYEDFPVNKKIEEIWQVEVSNIDGEYGYIYVPKINGKFYKDYSIIDVDIPEENLNEDDWKN